MEIVGERALRDLVALRQVRQKRNCTRVNGTVVEVSVDDVEVLVGAQVAERFAELELELREGDEVNLEPLADMLGEIEELVAVDSSKFERALEVVRREPRESGARRGRAAAAARRPGTRRPTAPADPARSGADGASRPRRRPRTRRPTARRDLRLSSRPCPTSRPSPSPSRRGSWCPSRPACWPTTTSPRRGGRSSGSTSPGWSRARPGPARGRMPRSCTRCASRRVVSERRGACSATPSTPSARRATGSGCASWRPTSARSATSTS